MDVACMDVAALDVAAMLSGNPNRRRRGLFYLAAVIAPGLALLLRLGLEQRYGALPHYILLYPVVLLVAMLGDAWAGLLVTITAALLTDYYVLPPFTSLRSLTRPTPSAWRSSA